MKIITISYRLPITLRRENNELTETFSSGGLASSLLSFSAKANCKLTWIGIADFDRTLWQEREENTDEPLEIIPVFLSRLLNKNFYEGFSNSVLYPLFTYFPSFVEFKLDYWNAYVEANKLMADKIISTYQEGDIIWIHDYHFIPLAGLLRKELPDAKIGFFLHIPFPSMELLKLLPHYAQNYLFDNLLEADLIGFHLWEYALNFIKTTQIILGAKQENFNIIYKNRKTEIGAYPISIDFEKFNSAYNLPEVNDYREEIRKTYNDKKIIFSVDRLDYTKGVLYRLNGFETFLEKYPEWQNRVSLILVIVPSREEITKYAERKSLIELAISRINGKLGNYNWTPIVFQYHSVQFNELAALYTASDIALVSPVRDGMNLVAKEFIASRRDKQGVLLLSELAGAAKELQDAIIFHPLNIEEIAESIQTGLNMPIEEQARRIDSMQAYVSKNNVHVWANKFLSDLQKKSNSKTEILDLDFRNLLLDQYSNAKKRLILLDYDGTLAPFDIDPDCAIPSNALLDILKTLSSHHKNEVWIISGRDKEFLDNHFSSLQLNLAAEHGAYIKRDQWVSITNSTQQKWINEVESILETFVALYPETFIEKKQNGIAWHYRSLEKRKGFTSSRELLILLKVFLFNKNLILTDGNCTVEVKHHLANKGIVYKNHIMNDEFETVLFIGDDETDEDLFKVLKAPHQHSIKIGKGHTAAKYRLDNIQLAASLLNILQHIH